MMKGEQGKVWDTFSRKFGFRATKFRGPRAGKRCVPRHVTGESLTGDSCTPTLSLCPSTRGKVIPGCFPKQMMAMNAVASTSALPTASVRAKRKPKCPQQPRPSSSHIRKLPPPLPPKPPRSDPTHTTPQNGTRLCVQDVQIRHTLALGEKWCSSPVPRG